MGTGHRLRIRVVTSREVREVTLSRGGGMGDDNSAAYLGGGRLSSTRRDQQPWLTIHRWDFRKWGGGVHCNSIGGETCLAFLTFFKILAISPQNRYKQTNLMKHFIGVIRHQQSGEKFHHCRGTYALEQ